MDAASVQFTLRMKFICVLLLLPSLVAFGFEGADRPAVRSYTVKPVASPTRSTTSLPSVLPLEVDIESAIEFVRIGYGDEFGKNFSSYTFRTRELRTKQVQQLVRLIKDYRSFNGEAVAQAIATFEGRVSSMQFGRELSPVLYVRLPQWTHQREMSPSDVERRRISDDENAKLIAELKRKFVEELGASEFGPERGDQRLIRVWWH